MTKKARLADFRARLDADPTVSKHTANLEYLKYEAQLDLIEAVQNLPGYNDVHSLLQKLQEITDELMAIRTRK